MYILRGELSLQKIREVILTEFMFYRVKGCFDQGPKCPATIPEFAWHDFLMYSHWHKILFIIGT